MVHILRVISLVVACLVLPASASAAGLAADLGPGVDVSRQEETGKVGFIGTASGRPIESGAAPDAAEAKVAKSFVEAHAKPLGLAGAVSSLQTVETHRTLSGDIAVRLQQLAGGLPVIGGEIVVNLTKGNDILSVLGEASPSPGDAVALSPAISAAEAARTALESVAKGSGVPFADLVATVPELSVYDPRLLSAPGPIQQARTAWMVQVTGQGVEEPIDERVIVDAQVGVVALQFGEVETAKNRTVCDAMSTSLQYPCTAPVRTEAGAPSADLVATVPELSVYDPRLLSAPGPIQQARTAWMVQVTGQGVEEPI
ncbi:MAG: hypothetical protein ABIZ50_02810, partial [Solirubrobacterales bacterium]